MPTWRGKVLEMFRRRGGFRVSASIHRIDERRSMMWPELAGKNSVPSHIVVFLAHPAGANSKDAQ